MLRPGLNGSDADRGAVEELEPVAGRIVEHDQVPDVPLVGERARAARHLGAGRFQPRRERVERGGVRHLPAEEADALPAVGVDHEPLLAVVHAEGHATSGSCRCAAGPGSSRRRLAQSPRSLARTPI